MAEEKTNAPDQRDRAVRPMPGRFGAYTGQFQMPDAPLAPHHFYTRVKFIDKKIPRVLISPEAYKRMQLYVELARLEVGWLGTAERLETGDFYIEHVFLLRQNAGAAHAKISVDGQTDLYNELVQGGRHADTRRLRFWGHSHVRMETAPSPQDDATMVELQEQRNKWFIRGILNKLGRASFDLYLFEQNLCFTDVPWEIWSPQPVVVEEPKTGLAAVSEGIAGFKKKVVAGAKRLMDNLSTDPVSKPETEMRGPLHISAELRAEVEAEIRDKVKISYMPYFGAGYGEVLLTQELVREARQEAKGEGGVDSAPAAASDTAPSTASGTAPASASAVSRHLPGPPESLPPTTRGGAASAGDSATSNAPGAKGE